MNKHDPPLSVGDKISAPPHARTLIKPALASQSTTGLMVFGCSNDEARAFHELGARFGISLMIVEDPMGESNADLARGTRCISVSHKTPITNRTLVALSNAGVEHISTRSIGFNHIDVAFAEHVGISVDNVSVKPRVS